MQPSLPDRRLLTDQLYLGCHVTRGPSSLKTTVRTSGCLLTRYRWAKESGALRREKCGEGRILRGMKSRSKHGRIGPNRKGIQAPCRSSRQRPNEPSREGSFGAFGRTGRWCDMGNFCSSGAGKLNTESIGITVVLRLTFTSNLICSRHAVSRAVTWDTAEARLCV